MIKRHHIGRITPTSATLEPAVDATLGTATLREPGPLVGSVVDDRNPSFGGRVLVRYDRDGAPVEHWLPVLHGAAVRFADTVLLVAPRNWCEPLVVGVVDGFSDPPKAVGAIIHTLELRPDELVEVRDSGGRVLLRIREADHAPVLSLAHTDVDLEIAGRLRVRAENLELAALRGALEIGASDDIAIRGEIIQFD